jgi:hypothetical protein
MYCNLKGTYAIVRHIVIGDCWPTRVLHHLLRRDGQRVMLVENENKAPTSLRRFWRLTVFFRVVQSVAQRCEDFLRMAHALRQIVRCWMEEEERILTGKMSSSGMYLLTVERGSATPLSVGKSRRGPPERFHGLLLMPSLSCEIGCLTVQGKSPDDCSPSGF